MMSYRAIQYENERHTREAVGARPQIAQVDGQIDRVPYVGYKKRVPGFKPVGKPLFVDKTGWGSGSEPALTFDQFQKHVRAGFGYAVVEEGEFQVYVQEYEVRKLKPRPVNAPNWDHVYRSAYETIIHVTPDNLSYAKFERIWEGAVRLLTTAEEVRRPKK
jgi:hypothetical protein